MLFHNREVITKALYCKHWSYSPGKRSGGDAREQRSFNAFICLHSPGLLVINERGWNFVDSDICFKGSQLDNSTALLHAE